MTELPQVTIHTDGACIGNPGPGGWAAILSSGDKSREMWGGEKHTTNNRMEMKAIIEGLKSLIARSKEAGINYAVTVVSDSKYVIDNIRGVPVWRARGWKTTAKKPVKNKDLWEELDEICTSQPVTFQWVKGHAGHPGNERADHLAGLAAQEAAKS